MPQAECPEVVRLGLGCAGRVSHLYYRGLNVRHVQELGTSCFLDRLNGSSR